MISVVVPIYNLEKVLERCILSILNQTYTNLEIILVNDGSTDGSLEICKKYAESDCRIAVISQENQGPYSARRTGVFAAKGEYIGHIDGDDWIEEEYFEKLYKATQNGKIDVVISNLMEHRDDICTKWVNGVSCGIYIGDEIEKKIYPVMLENDNNGNNYIMPSLCSKLFRRDLNVSNQIMENTIKCDEDNLNTYQMLLKAKSICVTDDCMYHYIRRNGSLTDCGIPLKQTLDSIKLVDEILIKEFSVREQRKLLCTQLKKYTANRIQDELKKYFQICTKPYIFPYEMVEKDSKIILYGAGDIGRDFYLQLKKNKYAEVILWVDKNYKKINVGYADICSPEKIEQCLDYDYVLICLRERNAVEVINGLKEHHVCEERIVWKKDYSLDVDYIFI